MAEDFNIAFGSPVPTIFFQALQQMLSGASHNIALLQTGNATLELPASAGHGQASIAIGNPGSTHTLFRWVTAPLTVTVSGTAGTYGIFACAAEADNYTTEEDKTNRAFTLAAVKTPSTPGSVYSYRQIATVAFDGTYITKITMSLGEPLSSLLGNILPPGTMVPFCGATVPEGWIAADGREVQIASYPALHDALGSTYNSEYKTNNGIEVTSGYFALPDMRGRAAVGADGMGITGRAFRLEAVRGNPYELGQSGGVQTVTLTIEQMPNHLHTLNIYDAGHWHEPPASRYFAGWDTSFGSGTQWVTNLSMSGPETSSWTNFACSNPYAMTGTKTATANIGWTQQSAGGSSYHQNMPPYLITQHIIKT